MKKRIFFRNRPRQET